MTAIAAVDLALWDIKAKAAQLPLYQLLGGRCRDGVTVYGHANGADIERAVDEVGRFVDLGYRAVRVQCGIPGLPTAYGVSDDKLFYEPAARGRPPEERWSTERYLSHVPRLFARLREVHGEELLLLHDVHHRLTPIEAARLGRQLEPFSLTWLEDPVPAELQEGFRLIRQHTTTPLAVGEVFNAIHDAHMLLTEQLIDHLRVSVLHGGGITPVRKMAALAELYHVRMSCHGATDLSPVTMAAALHFDLWVPNFGLQEYMRHTAETDEVFPHGYGFTDGRLHPGEAPGLGVELDAALAAKHPYQRAYLPVARKLDGTVFNW